MFLVLPKRFKLLILLKLIENRQVYLPQSLFSKSKTISIILKLVLPNLLIMAIPMVSATWMDTITNNLLLMQLIYIQL